MNCNEKELKEKILKFRDDELDHLEIGVEHDILLLGKYQILDKMIKIIILIALKISEKI